MRYVSAHQCDDQTKGSVTQDLPISYFGSSFTISAPAKGQQYVSHPVSLLFPTSEQNACLNM